MNTAFHYTPTANSSTRFVLKSRFRETANVFHIKAISSKLSSQCHVRTSRISGSSLLNNVLYITCTCVCENYIISDEANIAFTKDEINLRCAIHLVLFRSLCESVWKLWMDIVHEPGVNGLCSVGLFVSFIVVIAICTLPPVCGCKR